MKRIILLTTAATLAVGAVAAKENVVNVYNWSDYISEGILEKFEAETGIKVVYDVFDSNEVLEAKMLTGSSGYDVVVPTSDFLQRQIAAGAYQPLDKSKLPNLANMDAELMAGAAVYDPDNEYATIYMWGTTGIGYNVGAIAERLGEDYEVNSWELVFNPEIVSKLADCGVTMLDAPTEMIPAAMNYLGLDPRSTDKADFEAAAALLESVRPYIRYFNSSQYINDLANGDICVSVGWSGDVFQALYRAEEAENGVEIGYVIPDEGALQWFDMMAIPVDAPHADNAHTFINFIMDAQVTADITNYVWYANGNAASMPMVDDEIKSNTGIFPTEAASEKSWSSQVYDARTDRIVTRLWTRVKTGQ